MMNRNRPFIPQFYCPAITLLIATLFFISPIPHIVVFRNLLLLGLMVAILANRQALTAMARPPFGPETYVLAFLTAWMTLQTALWSVDRSFSFGNLTSEWLGTLLTVAIGYGMALTYADQCDKGKNGHYLSWVVLVFIIHGVWMIGYQAVKWRLTGHYDIGLTPYGDYSVLSIPINMAFALLAADVALRLSYRNRLFPWPSWIALGLIGLTCLSIVAVKARNGMISAFAVLTVLGILLAWKEMQKPQRKVNVAAVLLVLVLACGISIASFQFDPRWATFTETASIAMDTKTNLAWQGMERFHLPLLKSGQPVEESAYLRIAWAKIAMEGIVHRPLGYGYGLGGFGRYIEEVYGYRDFVSSHSGILDFTLANGLPALALLLVFCVMFFRRGWLSLANGNPWGLALMLTLTNYFVRILLDGHFGSYRLKMFALLAGMLYWLTIPQARSK
jgi:hypothetical protein